MSQPQGSRYALTFIFITVLIDMATMGVIMPVLPDLIRDLTGKDLAGASFYGGGADAVLCRHAVFVFAHCW
ncbi:MAG: hypothetical protein Q9M45_11260 [Robiginitomaculum sp.]|nr:hypothetical protein [Robiginitomaculum sp.]